MIERYTDGLQRSASRAKEFIEEKSEIKKAELFVDFIDGIKVAAGSAHQLAHAQENPKWIDTRDLLEGVIAVSQSITVFSGVDPSLWTSIKTSLERMIVTGKNLYTAKAMLRSDVLRNLDAREKRLRESLGQSS